MLRDTIMANARTAHHSSRAGFFGDNMPSGKRSKGSKNADLEHRQAMVIALAEAQRSGKKKGRK